MVFSKLAKLIKSPYVKNSVHFALIYAAGDLTQQKFVMKNTEYDLTNTRNAAVVGGCMLSPLYVLWYNVLDKFLPGTCRLRVVQKLVIDQAIAGVLGIGIFLAAMSAMEGKDRKHITEELIDKTPTVYMFNLGYWPFLMYGIFRKVPVNLQPLAVASGDYLWSIFLCYYKMKKMKHHPNPIPVEGTLPKERPFIMVSPTTKDHPLLKERLPVMDHPPVIGRPLLKDRLVLMDRNILLNRPITRDCSMLMDRPHTIEHPLIVERNLIKDYPPRA